MLAPRKFITSFLLVLSLFSGAGCASKAAVERAQGYTIKQTHPFTGDTVFVHEGRNYVIQKKNRDWRTTEPLDPDERKRYYAFRPCPPCYALLLLSVPCDLVTSPCQLYAWYYSPRIPNPHPLAGWTYRPFDEYASPRQQRGYKLNAVIATDSTNFIKSFGKNWRLDRPLRGFYEDGEGNRAIEIQMYHRASLEGRLSHYILFYDATSRRTKKTRFLASTYGPFDF